MKLTRKNYKIANHFDRIYIVRSPLIVGVLFNHFHNLKLMSVIEDCYHECKSDLKMEEELSETIIELNIEYAKLFLDEYGFEYKQEETLEDMFPGEYKGNEKL